MGIDIKNPTGEISRGLDIDKERNGDQKIGLEKKTKSTIVWRGKKGRGSVINMTRISERKENGTQDTFEDIMTRNFPDLMTDIRLWTDTRSLMNPKQNNYNPPLIIF